MERRAEGGAADRAVDGAARGAEGGAEDGVEGGSKRGLEDGVEGGVDGVGLVPEAERLSPSGVNDWNDWSDEGNSMEEDQASAAGTAEVPEEDEFIEDAEQRSEEVQKERFEKAKAQHAHLIQKLRSAYPLASEFLARLKEIGFSTDGLLEAEEDPAALDAAVSSSTQWCTRVRMHPVCVYAS